MDSDAIVEQLNELAPPAMRMLGGRFVAFDKTTTTLSADFRATENMTHSGGIVQGGFVTGMIDAVMAHAIYAALEDLAVCATLEIKVSFLQIARAGLLHAHGRVVRMGKSIAFLDGELRSPDGELLAAASSTAKIIRPRPVAAPPRP